MTRCSLTLKMSQVGHTEGRTQVHVAFLGEKGHLWGTNTHVGGMLGQVAETDNNERFIYS